MIRAFMVVGAFLCAVGCAQLQGGGNGSGGAAPAAAAAKGSSRTVPSIDSSFDGEMIGTPAAGSRFEKVRIGMRSAEVERLIGPPDDSEGHITGKAFIPFFFGGDTHRREAFYKGDGILTYSPQHLGGESNTLIRIIADPSEQGVAH